MVSGCLRCTYCQSELIEEQADSSSGLTDSRSLMAKFNDEIEPIYALLRKVEDIRLSSDILEPEPTDYRLTRLVQTFRVDWFSALFELTTSLAYHLLCSISCYISHIVLLWRLLLYRECDDIVDIRLNTNCFNSYKRWRLYHVTSEFQKRRRWTGKFVGLCVSVRSIILC